MFWIYISYVSFFIAFIHGIRPQIVTVDHIPEILPHKASGRVTSTTMVLGQPLCYFNTLTQLKCSQSTCQVWAVIASGPGVTNFDADKLDTALQILNASPYPTAFSSQTNKMYYVTKLGRPNDFPCGQLPGIRYFKVGAENNCTTNNCNGILPPGSTIRLKYLLIDPVTREVVSESKWSYPIVLTTMRSWSSIDESIGNRSGGMVVITVISTCLLAVLLLLVGVVLLLDCLGSFRGGHEISTGIGYLDSIYTNILYY
ncbi:uroplakin-3b [Esox lucius]|uniref:uroplakin-3b n=1 Tax=Esox lucius TaxID=8010 RepID=UPI000575E433|nr:uroplakin-3b [Esox lucius]